MMSICFPHSFVVFVFVLLWPQGTSATPFVATYDTPKAQVIIDYEKRPYNSFRRRFLSCEINCNYGILSTLINLNNSI